MPLGPRDVRTASATALAASIFVNLTSFAFDASLRGATCDRQSYGTFKARLTCFQFHDNPTAVQRPIQYIQ